MSTHQESKSSTPSSNRQGNIKQSGRRIVLIADKSPEFADALSRSLGTRDFTCIVADDGENALSMFHERRPDVIVLSYSIAKEEDGAEAATEILQSSSRAEVVILMNSGSKISDKLERAGVELFIDKETSIPRIVDSICAISNLKKSTCNLVAR